MTSRSGKRRRKKKHLKSLLRSSNMRITCMWTGKERPLIPGWFGNSLYKPPLKRKKTPRALRHH